MSRKNFINTVLKIVGGIAVLGAGGLLIAKPKEKSQDYSPFFSQLNDALKLYKRAIPELLIDLDTLDANIAELKKLIPNNANFRIVVKSLPCRDLINYIMAKINTKKLMVFHQPFLSHLAEFSDSEVDILMGKPMPVKTVSYFYETLKPNNGFEASKQLQWLVDTDQRINNYIALAKNLKVHLLLNLEIDVGLHRGGFDNLASVENALKIIQENKEHVSFSGFMGYDPHIVKVPSILLSRAEAYKRVKDFYNDCKNLVKEKFPSMWHENLTFNGAGSPSLEFHAKGDSPLNDIAAGSCLVKPTDFDIDSLTQFKPASYIATPVLKKYKNTPLASIEKFKGLLNTWDSNMKNAYYIYGGSWMADLYEPKGVKLNPLFGKSTNQILINASDKTPLEVGDFVFLRPHQSEFVFLQFGNILPFRNNEIEGEWSLLNNA